LKLIKNKENKRIKKKLIKINLDAKKQKIRPKYIFIIYCLFLFTGAKLLKQFIVQIVEISTKEKNF
jgi:hypothetical protein